MSQKIVIIGNGVAGITAARHIRKNSDYTITVISAETEYFFSRTALMYVFMGHMKFEHIKPYEDWFWKKNKIDLIFNRVESIDFSGKILRLQSGEKLNFDKLIIATGSKSRTLGCPGEDLEGVITFYNYQDLKALEKLTRGKSRSVIIGGGLVGIELAEMLHSRNIQVDFLIREDSYWRDVLPLPEAQLISNHIKKYGINLHFNSVVTSIEGNSYGKVSSVSVSGSPEKLNCDLACIGVGVKPNIDFLSGTEISCDSGILVNKFLETNVDGVYAIGDCAQLKEPDPGRKAIEPVWYTGKMMGEVVANTLCGNRMEYHPGHWFNSAKFFSIEYQVYGSVPNERGEDFDWFYWQDQGKEKALRLVWSGKEKHLIGVHSLGMRLSHPVINQWLNQKRHIGSVVENLAQINFDPELFTRYEKEIQARFNAEHPELVVVKQPAL